MESPARPPTGDELARREAEAREEFNRLITPAMAPLFATLERVAEGEAWRDLQRRADLPPDFTALREAWDAVRTTAPYGETINGVPVDVAAAVLRDLGIQEGARFLSNPEEIQRARQGARHARLAQEWLLPAP